MGTEKTQRIALITGAYGFIGRHVAREFHRNGWFVIGIGHGEWDRDEQTAWGVDDWQVCDVSIESLSAFGKKPDVIVHCAGGSSVGKSIQEPMEDFLRTVCTTECVLEYMRQCASRASLLFLSSAAVYGKSDKFPLRETASLHPISPYGCHKKMCEELCALYAKQYHLKVLILRVFSVYGNGLRKQLLWDACNKLEHGTFEFWGTGEEVRDWIHVLDVARCIHAVATSNEKSFDVLNVASGNPVRIKCLLETIFELYGEKRKPFFNGKIDVGNPSSYLADIEKMRGLFQGELVDIQTGIESYVRWFKYGGN